MKNHERNSAVKIFKNLANAKRIKILEAIIQQDKITVSEIAKSTDLDQASVSNNLAKMRADGLVSAKQSGLNMHYSIKDSNIAKLLKAVQS